MFTFAIPNVEGVEVSLDIAEIPAEIRAKMLQGAAKNFVLGRANVANVRFNKLIAPWLAYDADPVDVAKPEGDRPAAPDLVKLVTEAKADLLAGKIRERGKGEGKSRQPKDPLDAAVTGVVVRELFTRKKAADPKYTFIMATKEVGSSGLAFLKASVDAKVEGGSDRAALEKVMESRYLAPARKLVGVGKDGKAVEPSADDIF